MTTSQVTVKTLAVLALVVGFTSAARGQPTAVTAEWAFKQNPKQPGVNVSTPSPDQVGRCKVSPIADPKAPGKTMGYLVTDPAGNPVRQFVSYDGKNFNIISFYLDGVEAYREVYPPVDPQKPKREPFQYRWLGPNGSKWGLDNTHTFVIDDWVAISPEEVSQEVFKALLANDPKKLAPLLVTKEHLTGIGLPAAEVNDMVARAAGAGKRLTDTAAQLKLSDKAKWDHASFGVPHTKPADSFGAGTTDLLAYKNGTVIVDVGGNDPRTMFQMGELVQVGRAWKLVDGPAPGGAPVGPAPGPQIEPQIAALVKQLNDHDMKTPMLDQLAAHNAARAQILEGIVAGANAKETWARMLIDSHAQAAEGAKLANNPHLTRIKQWRDAMAKPEGNAPLAAYAAFKYLVAENSVALAGAKPDGSDLGEIQERWRAGLEDFVKAYGTAPDAPEAVLRLAMAWELSGAKNAEAKAKEWYERLTKDYATHAHAAKATGALKRLDCEGKPLELSGPLLAKPTEQFNAAQKDKIVVVYFWASWSESTIAEDAKKLQALEKAYAAKGVTIVTVGLDHRAKDAADTVARVGLPGTHLYAPTPAGGTENPMAATYGIMAPPHILIAGKDGKIVNRNGHTAMLEDDVKKLLGEK